MIPTVQATVFHRFMTTGRTSPALFGCEDGAGQSVGEQVVKLRGSLERGVTGLASELVASRLASYFRIPVPAPVLVAVDQDFADLVAATQPSHAKRMRDIGTSGQWKLAAFRLASKEDQPRLKTLPQFQDTQRPSDDSGSSCSVST